jgi:hypothetical protein
MPFICSREKACPLPRDAALCSILDIDLDYFNLVKSPEQRLLRLLKWAGRPVDFFVEKHHAALKKWLTQIEKRKLSSPTHILHVDEHHDMMDEQSVPNIANVIIHAMRRWPECRVHWLVEDAIESPEMWLDEETWKELSSRFTMGTRRPQKWPKPDIVSMCTSPAFVPKLLEKTLLAVIEKGERLQVIKHLETK